MWFAGRLRDAGNERKNNQQSIFNSQQLECTQKLRFASLTCGRAAGLALPARRRERVEKRLKEKIKWITRKTAPMTFDERIAKLNQVIKGWMHYFKIEDYTQ